MCPIRRCSLEDHQACDDFPFAPHPNEPFQISLRYLEAPIWLWPPLFVQGGFFFFFFSILSQTGIGVFLGVVVLVLVSGFAGLALGFFFWPGAAIARK